MVSGLLEYNINDEHGNVFVYIAGNSNISWEIIQDNPDKNWDWDWDWDWSLPIYSCQFSVSAFYTLGN